MCIYTSKIYMYLYVFMYTILTLNKKQNKQ